METKIKFVVFDFDGVFSDGKIFFSQDGVTHKSYNGKDSWALKLLKKKNIKSGIISLDKIISLKHAPHIFDRLDKCSLGEDRQKIEVLDEWLEEYNLSYSEVAYIGDDIADISVLEKVGFPACPSDAIDSVKKVCKYVCSKNGGNGAVREFVDLIVNNNKELELKNSNQPRSNKFNNYGKITAVIPVKKKSKRCENKNIRPFGDTNLLELKIKTLKRVANIDKILVTSNSDEMLDMAKSLGVGTHKRDDKYCTNDNPGEYFKHLAEIIDTDILMHTPCTTPFMSVGDYESAIKTYFSVCDKNDSVNCTTPLQDFLWNNSAPLNYDYSNPVPSQELPIYEILNFGFNIIEKELAIKYRNVVGKNPYFIQKDSIRGLDIDDEYGFTTTELFYDNDIRSESDVTDIFKRKSNNKVELLDCTIRDGGYLNNWEFSTKEVIECYTAVSKSGYDYFEIGFKSNPKFLVGKGKWCYSKEKDIRKVVESYDGCKIAVMAKVGTFQISDFMKKKDSYIDMVRVLLARATHTATGLRSEYNEYDIIEARNNCNQLSDLGYEVCVNFGCGDLITDTEVKLICKHFHDSTVKALYLADTYGGFDARNVSSQLHTFYRELDKYDSDLNLGFHSHSNNDNSLDKTKVAMYHGCTMVDSCIGGMGRGAGNLKSELFLLELFKLGLRNVNDVFPLVEYYDKYVMSRKEYRKNMSRPTYHPYYAIAGVLQLHPNYILEILENTGDSVLTELDLIVKLDKYTKEKNRRNYDKKLIQKLK